MNKQDILEATLELACEKGLGNISMSQIADKVHLKKSSLYSHFKSKDEIIENMYAYFRLKAKNQNRIQEMDYDVLFEGRTLKEILHQCVNSYRQINSDPDMNRFYRLVMAQRVHDPMAAHIMIEETNKMIHATKLLFYALSAKKVADFADPDGAAVSFAMGVHSILDYEFDAQNAKVKDAEGIMDRYIEEFCRIYGKDEVTI